MYRLFLLLFTIIFGLYGLVIGSFLIVINLCNVESFGKPYLLPIAPYDKNYFFKTLLTLSNFVETSFSALYILITS